MRRGIIYKWTNKINNKCYIGKTVNEEQRKYQHLHDRRCKSLFHQAIDKYGINNFDYEILFETKSSDENRLNYILNSMEQFYIRRYKSNSQNFGYNLTKGGDGISGRFGEDNPFFNHHHTEEWKQQHSEVMKGRKPSEETLRKRSESLKKVVHTKEWNAKVGKALEKGVIAYKDGIEIGKYTSYTECMNALNLPNIKGISKVVCGHNKTYKGYTFSKMTNEEKNAWLNTKIEDNTINKSEE